MVRIPFIRPKPSQPIRPREYSLVEFLKNIQISSREPLVDFPHHAAGWDYMAQTEIVQVDGKRAFSFVPFTGKKVPEHESETGTLEFYRKLKLFKKVPGRGNYERTGATFHFTTEAGHLKTVDGPAYELKLPADIAPRHGGQSYLPFHGGALAFVNHENGLDGYAVYDNYSGLLHPGPNNGRFWLKLTQENLDNTLALLAKENGFKMLPKGSQYTFSKPELLARGKRSLPISSASTEATDTSTLPRASREQRAPLDKVTLPVPKGKPKENKP